MASPELPSPAEAMRRAVDCAEQGSDATGMLWVAIARELREGASPSPTLTEQADIATALGIPCPEAFDVGVPPGEEERQYREMRAADETQVLRPEGMFGEAATDVIERPRCGNCGRLIEWRVPGDWWHVQSDTMTCSAPIDGDATYATPKLN